MTPRTINLLHVEDDAIEQALICQFLNAIEGFSFAVTAATTEEAAVAAFRRGGIEFVILDYQLESGDGLSCLHKVRRLDPYVPVVVVSGTATPEVVAEFLRFGADGYLSKGNLNPEDLAQSIRAALRRADEWRRQDASETR